MDTITYNRATIHYTGYINVYDHDYYITRGGVYYYVDNELHRVGEPAMMLADGTIRYYEHGLLHRIGEPADLCANGTKRYCIHGLLDRIDGPAIERKNGDDQYYVSGYRFYPEVIKTMAELRAYVKNI